MVSASALGGTSWRRDWTAGTTLEILDGVYVWCLREKGMTRCGARRSFGLWLSAFETIPAQMFRRRRNSNVVHVAKLYECGKLLKHSADVKVSCRLAVEVFSTKSPRASPLS